MRKAFNFYFSFYEQFEHLENEQIAIMVMIICKVQFLELHIDDVEFEDKMSKLAWSGIRHSLQASIDGYCTKMGIDYNETLTKGLDKVLGDKKNKKEKSNEEVEEKEKEKSSNNSLLDTKTDEIIVAEYLLKKIMEKKPNFKQPNIKVWAKDIKFALDEDKRMVNELLGCIDWIYSPEGAFWVPNILSAKKLREKFDVMESQMMNNPKNKSKSKIANVLAKGGY